MIDNFIQKDVYKKRFKNKGYNKGVKQAGKQKCNYYKKKLRRVGCCPLEFYLSADIMFSLPEILKAKSQGYNTHYYNTGHMDETLGQYTAENE